jgi:hypothetical protein
MNANMPMTEIPDYRARYYDPESGIRGQTERFLLSHGRVAIRVGAFPTLGRSHRMGCSYRPFHFHTYPA